MTDARDPAAAAPDPTRLDGQWAVVTGSSKGIGLGIAEAFVDAGASVMLVARGEGDLAAAAKALQDRAGPGQTVLARQTDTSDIASVETLFQRIREDLPALDVFVANAGAGVVTPFLDIPLDEWNRSVALNLTGTFLCCQRAGQLMAAAPDRVNRAILVVSSIRAEGVRPGRLAYSTAKAGLNQLVRVAAYELAEHGVRVNALSPGITATPMAVEGNPEVFAEMAATVPLRRAGDPSDMGAAALYLCSPAARFVTGANLVVDGGEALW
jgi:NAD(P)-dependent dehydrogenase (short-subunit alcohol dehydrogenase family)